MFSHTRWLGLWLHDCNVSIDLPLLRFTSLSVLLVPSSSEGPASCALLLVVFPHCGFPFLRISFRFLCKSFILSLYLTLTLYLYHMYLLTRWLTFYSTFSFSPLVYIFCFLFLLSYVYLHFHPRQLNIPSLDVFLVPSPLFFRFLFSLWILLYWCVDTAINYHLVSFFFHSF